MHSRQRCGSHAGTPAQDFARVHVRACAGARTWPAPRRPASSARQPPSAAGTSLHRHRSPHSPLLRAQRLAPAAAAPPHARPHCSLAPPHRPRRAALRAPAHTLAWVPGRTHAQRRTPSRVRGRRCAPAPVPRSPQRAALLRQRCCAPRSRAPARPRSAAGKPQPPAGATRSEARGPSREGMLLGVRRVSCTSLTSPPGHSACSPLPDSTAA